MIQPGLERIGKLLRNVHFPWKAIHVAGTNGKGSICHHASSLLTDRRIKCGKFTSPHLVDRWDCISIDEKPVSQTLFRRIEKHYTQLSLEKRINASQFEILTATAFTIFNLAKVSVGVVEVGMGGKLDATNILNNQAVSVISKIARDHEGFLGNTLEEIAQHKAGILRPNVPFIVNPLNESNVHNVIDQYAQEIGAGPRLTGDTDELREELYSSEDWHRFAGQLQPFQRDNAVLAILAVKEVAKSLELKFENSKIAKALVKLRKKAYPGRLQYLTVQPVFGKPGNPGREIVVDGAHNPDAAEALNEFVLYERRRSISGQQPPQGGWPVTWILAMTEGKDARQYLELLLKPGDNVVTTSFGAVDGMPWVKPMDPRQLLEIAKSVQPDITGLHITEAGPLRALCAAKYLAKEEQPIVMTGSLYLVGDFYRDLRPLNTRPWLRDLEKEENIALFRTIDEEERHRVDQMYIPETADDGQGRTDKSINEERQRRIDERERRRKLQEEIYAIDKEIERLTAEEERDPQAQPLDSEEPAATITPGPMIDATSEPTERDENSACSDPSTTSTVAKPKPDDT